MDRYTTEKKLTLEICLGLASMIPPVGAAATVIGGAKAIREYVKDRNGWLSFIHKLSTECKKKPN